MADTTHEHDLSAGVVSWGGALPDAASDLRSSRSPSRWARAHRTRSSSRLAVSSSWRSTQALCRSARRCRASRGSVVGAVG